MVDHWVMGEPPKIEKMEINFYEDNYHTTRGKYHLTFKTITSPYRKTFPTRRYYNENVSISRLDGKRCKYALAVHT